MFNVSFFTQLYLAGALGITSHLGYFITGEHHLRAPRLLALYLLIFFTIFLGYFVGYDFDMRHAGAASTMVITTYVLCLFSSIAIYRLLFHRVRKFPGPTFAKVSKLWHASKVLNSDQHLLLDRLHKQYGDFVRTGPNEITIFRPEAVMAIHGPGSRCSKSAFYDALHPYVAVNTTRSKLDHIHRRRIWDQGFSIKALQDYESRIFRFVRQLDTAIAQCAGEAVNVTFWFNLYTFDTMGDLAFGKSFGQLEEGRSHFAIDLLRNGMAIIGPATPLPWLFHITSGIPGLPATRGWQRLLNWASEQLQHRIKIEASHPDVMSHLIAASYKDSSIEADMNWLNGDSLAIVIAGSESVSAALTFLFYHLAASPENIEKLRAELAGVDPILDAKALETMVHLNGIIFETLRLHPPVPASSLRDTPPEGLMVADQHIPGNTTVLAPAYTLGRLESCFERAQDFIPERWYSMPHMVKNRTAFIPFIVGSYSCVGRNLALIQLRAVTALLVTHYDIAFAPREEGVDLFKDAKEYFTISPGKLDLVFTLRS